jgi:hypothetical protein
MKFEIVSFEGPLPLRFGMSPAETMSVLGTPESSGPNWRGVLCHDYYQSGLSLSIGFGGEGGTTNHFGFGRGSSVRFRDVDFFANRNDWRALLLQSTDFHLLLGFLIFCDLGIALTGFHDDYEDDLAISVFPKGEWEEDRQKFKPYVPK